MKKIIVTLAILSVLFCLLAISVGAIATDEFGTVETFEGMTEKGWFGADGKAGATSRVVMFDGTEYHTYPSYYIFQDLNETELTFDELNSKSGKSYSMQSIIRLEVPNGIQRYWDRLKNSTNVKYVYLPESVILIGGYAFQNCSNLEWVNVPKNCHTIVREAFNGCTKLAVIDMTQATALKRTEDDAFKNCNSLKSLIFPEGFEYFGGFASTSLEELYLPDSVYFLGGMDNASSLKTFKVPLGVTSLRGNQFNYCSGINTVILHKNMTSVDSNTFNQTNYVSNIIYTGNENDAIVSSIIAAASGATITYGNQCDYYYNGEHLDDTNPCVINCTRCGSVNAPKENPNHNVITSISYLSYDMVGTRMVSCTNEGCAYEVTENIPALFVCKGYSASLTGSAGIVLGFQVNNRAISEYEEETGKAIKYGVFAASQEKLQDDDVFENGIANENVVCAEIKAIDFAAFEIKVIGITDDKKDVPLALGAYVEVSDGVTTEYSYMQATDNGEKTGNYYFVSYNDIVK